MSIESISHPYNSAKTTLVQRRLDLAVQRFALCLAAHQHTQPGSPGQCRLLGTDTRPPADAPLWFSRTREMVAKMDFWPRRSPTGSTGQAFGPPPLRPESAWLHGWTRHLDVLRECPVSASTLSILG